MGWYREEFEKLAKTLTVDLRLYVQPMRHREQVLVEPAQRQRLPIAAGKEVEADLLAVRMPDPSSGVAVVDGQLVEVRDAANGVGQTVKLRIVAVDGNMARAELAEPLPAAKRRRRRRGKVAGETEEPAKPTPPPQPTRIDRIAVPSNIFGLEEEEEDYTMRGRPVGRTRGVSASTTTRPAPRGRGEGRPAASGGSRGRGRRGGRGDLADARGFKPLVVGGEADIDYDDSDESSVTVVPDKTKPIAGGITPVRGDDTETTTAGRRRRRRGRGGRGLSKSGRTHERAARRRR